MFAGLGEEATHTGLTGRSSSDQKSLHVVMFMFNDTFRCQHHRSYPGSFITIFTESRARDVVFIAGRVVDGSIKLCLHTWELDRFGDRVIIPYHIRFCIEGIPQHAWHKAIANAVLCDEAVVHHVESDTMDNIDQRSFNYWVLSKDNSKIPRDVYLTITKHDLLSRRGGRIQFSRPRAPKQGHVFEVFIHIDTVEDLMFYHYPWDELIADGKVPRREFSWQMGRADGDLDVDETQPSTRYCASGTLPRRHWRDDDKTLQRQKERSFFNRVSSWMDHSKSRERPDEGHRGRTWFRGESFH
jgi:hypothetical protein